MSLTANKKAQRVEITPQNPRVLICAYGTLRHGEGNWSGRLEGRSTYLGTYQTEPEYTMYGKYAGFPIVVDKGESAITYDVFEVTDNNVLNSVHRLEGCTGVPGHPNNWYDIKPIETPHGRGYMYVQHTHGRKDSVIASGDWLNQ